MNKNLWVRNIRPLWIREKIYFHFLTNTTLSDRKEILETSLEFFPNIRLEGRRSDIIYHQIFITGIYELKLSKIILKLAKNGGLLLDAGANIGYYSLLWTGARKDNQSIAFEPVPQNIALLRRNIARNRLQNQIQTVEKALSTFRGKTYFTFGSWEQTGWGGIVLDKKNSDLEVPVISMDEFAYENNIRKINVLKIDTEGADTLVLRGASNLLKSHQIAHIFYEKNLARMEKLNLDQGEAEKLLYSFGYHIRPLGKMNFYAFI